MSYHLVALYRELEQESARRGLRASLQRSGDNVTWNNELIRLARTATEYILEVRTEMDDWTTLGRFALETADMAARVIDALGRLDEEPEVHDEREERLQVPPPPLHEAGPAAEGISVYCVGGSDDETSEGDDDDGDEESLSTRSWRRIGF